MKRASILALVAISMGGCVSRDFGTQNRADVILRVNGIQGSTGTATGGTGQTGQQLFSDVLTCTGPDADGIEQNCTTVNDSAIVTLAVIQKNPTATLTNLEDVVLSTYTVEYQRSDGRGVEGVDIPFNISGNVSQLITVGGTTTLPITVVRHQAKDEPPLRNLIFVGTADLITMSAKITVFGRTTSGKEVSAYGYLEITFADFGP